jgi:transmembrane sensor
MNTQIYAEACEWLVEFRTEDVDQGTRSRFEKWLSASPQHVRAYLEVSGIWETAGSQPHANADDIDALIERARATPDVVPLSVARERQGSSSKPSRASFVSRRHALRAMVAALLLAVIGIGTYVYDQRSTYSTAIGEQRSILLPDGSTVDLNARSRIRVRLGEHERHIDLLEGQALFRVAKDKARPFVVAANGTRVRAVGTQFDINQRRRDVVVTVVEGTVAVHRVGERGVGTVAAQAASPIAPAPGEILLAAGQQMTLSVASEAGSTPVPAKAQPADIDTATAWTQRRLIFNSTALDDVAEEFNRNNERPLVIEGTGLEDFHVSGAFSSTNPEPLLRFLRAQSGIRVTEHSDRIVVSRAD